MQTLAKCLIVFVVSYLLFFALSPGVLLTLPPGKGSGCKVPMQLEKSSNKNCATSMEAVAVHAAIFSLLMALICFFCCQNKMM